MACFHMMTFVLVLSPLTTAKLTIDVFPKTLLKAGDTVMLTCYSNLNDSLTMDSICDLFWTRKSQFDLKTKEELITDSPTHSIKTNIFPYSGNPFSTVLAIGSIVEEDSATYNCHLNCQSGLRQRNRFQLEITGGNPVNELNATLIAGAVSIFVIIVLLASVLLVSCYQHKLRARLETARQSQMPASASSDDLIPEVHEEGCGCQGCKYREPPPCYSQVVNMAGPSASGTPPAPEKVTEASTPSTCEEEAVPTEATPVGSARQALSRPTTHTKPPDYNQALEFLAKDGIIFDSSNLTPMPPAYNQASEWAAEGQRPLTSV